MASGLSGCSGFSLVFAFECVCVGGCAGYIEFQIFRLEVLRALASGPEKVLLPSTYSLTMIQTFEFYAETPKNPQFGSRCRSFVI